MYENYKAARSSNRYGKLVEAQAKQSAKRVAYCLTDICNWYVCDFFRWVRKNKYMYTEIN